MSQYISKLIGKAYLAEPISKDRLAAAQQRYELDSSLEDRGKFPVGVVSQPDTLALKSVILTTGRPGNLNDDVMLNEEVLPILFTAALKPFNIEHTKHIIGVMFDAFAVDKTSGRVTPSIERFNEDETDEDRELEQRELQSVIGNLPENLDIITNQVLWTLHFPDEVREIKRKAVKGDLFVSMEVWFTSFDYLVGNRIIERTADLAAILDPKLRVNGGNGLLGLERIRRVPRNLTFAGNAVVETPANPDSFILDVMDKHDLEVETHLEVEANVKCLEQLLADNTLCTLESLSDKDETNPDRSDVGEFGRSDEPLGSEACGSELVEAKLDEVVNESDKEIKMEKDKLVELLEKNAVLQSDNDKAVADLAGANKDKEELQAKNTELEAELEAKLALIKEKEEELAAKAEAFDALESEKTELKEKLDATSTELAEIEEARKLEARKAQLVELGLEEARVIKVLAKTSELDEEAFNAELEDIKAFMSELTPVVNLLEKPEVIEEETPEEVVEPEVAEVEEEIEEEVAEEVDATEEELAEVLDEAEEEEVPVAEAVASATVDADEDEAEQIKAVMAKVLDASRL